MAQTAQQATRYMQGIAVPAESVRPAEFFARTRRHTTLEKQTAYAGMGGQDVVEIRKSDILAGLLIKFSGSLVVGAGVTSTARWPYDLIRQVRFTANGQSNIINCSGLKLKARDFMARGDLNDRGVSQTIGGVARTQGTLSQAAELWGVGSNSTLSANTYPVELEWWVPVAEDEVDLAGAIFAATSSTDLTLTIDWETVGNLFTGGVPTLTGTVQIVATKYSIPIGSNGEIVVPDLSVFHSMIQSRQAAIVNGDNEPRLVGQGIGKSLLRAFYQVWSGATPAPLPMNATNFGKQAWRFAGNETPDEFVDGQHLREVNERYFGVDLGGLWGFGVHDFAKENAFRDVVDMGTASELRLLINIPSGVTLTGAAVEYVTETVFQAGAGA
jgi:hypothetical protein